MKKLFCVLVAIDGTTHEYFQHGLTHEEAIATIKRSYTFAEIDRAVFMAIEQTKEVYDLYNGVSDKPCLTFSWDFEDVGDRVITSCDVSLDCTSLIIEDLQDVRIDGGIPAARKYAKKYAKQHGYSFKSEEADSYGYRSALMTCYNRNK